MPYNYGCYEYVKFDIEKIKEYDKEGMENYLKNCCCKLEAEELDIRI